MWDGLLIVTLGWCAGAAFVLALRYIDNGKKPIDPALLPKSPPPVPLPLEGTPLSVARCFSPYAPKPKRPIPPAKPRLTRWPTEAPRPPVDAQLPRAPTLPPAPQNASTPSGRLLPSVRWGG